MTRFIRKRLVNLDLRSRRGTRSRIVQIEDALRRVKNVIPHFDKVAFLVSGNGGVYKKKSFRESLRPLYLFCNARSKKGKPIKPWHYQPSQAPHSWRLELKAPSGRAFTFLQGLALKYRCEYKVSQVEVAVDLITKDSLDAEILGQWINSIIVRPYQRCEAKVVWKKTTRYTNPRKWGMRNVVSYYDMLSKSSGEPCLHIELRHSSARNLRRFGLSSLEDVKREGAAKEFLNQNLHLEVIDLKALGRHVIAKKLLVPHMEEDIKRSQIMAGGKIAHFAMAATAWRERFGVREPFPSSQSLKDYARNQRWKWITRVFRRIEKPIDYFRLCSSL